jgi:hypothetical protein|tara:strand:- start:296 stop:592 length:297 start_codon:yes stop_codon:yes gene_type:complete
MESVKVQEIKDGAIIDIKVNKTFYMMCKASLYTLFKENYDIKNGNPETFIKNIVSQPYDKLNEKERLFHTFTLLIGEIETQAKAQDLLLDKDNLEDAV